MVLTQSQHGTGIDIPNSHKDGETSNSSVIPVPNYILMLYVDQILRMLSDRKFSSYIEQVEQME